MNKISEQNPADTVLDEIHAIQKKLFSVRKNLTWKEKKKLMDSSTSEFGKKHNIKPRIVSHDKIAVLIK